MTTVITSPLVPVDQRETPNPQDGHQAFAKIDHRLTTSQTLTLRYRADKSTSKGDGIGGTALARARHQHGHAESGRRGQRDVRDVVARAQRAPVSSSRGRSTFTDTDGWSVDGMPEIIGPR
jgi:hypothetical protein